MAKVSINPVQANLPLQLKKCLKYDDGLMHASKFICTASYIRKNRNSIKNTE